MTYHNLPNQLTPFIGRESDITEIGDLLCEEDCRLLSLIGPGGMGKTRLALEIAERKIGDFADGVFLVALQPLASSESVASLIASSINFELYDDDEHLPEQLMMYLSEKEMLLVLDNFEHVLNGTGLVANLLMCAPRIKILATSREALKLQQEWVHPVTGMSFPDDMAVSEIDSYSAIRLFVERAQQFRRNFAFEKELPHIIRICQLVGGMPLGIELAVAWLKTLSCAEIASEIEKNFDLLTAQMRDIAERHQSVRVIFDATWQMLTTTEQSVFMRLSFFRDMPTRQAIQAVTDASLLTLSSLTDKALLIPVENGRYRLHELLRQYAYEKLEASDELEAVKDVHSEYYLRFLAERQLDVHGRRQIEAISEIDLDFENIRLAWAHAVEQKNADGIASAVETLCVYLHFRSRWKHESHMVTEAQACFAPLDGEKPSLIWAMLAARDYGSNDDPIGTLKQALEIVQEQDNQAEIGLYLQLLGLASGMYDHQPQESIRYIEASMPYFEAANDQYHLAAAYGYLGMYHRLLGNEQIALSNIEKCLTMSRNNGDIDSQAFATAELSNIMFMLGNLEEAEHYRRESILLAKQIGRIWSCVGQNWGLAIFFLFGIHGSMEEAQEITEDSIYLKEATYYKGHVVSTPLTKSLYLSMDGNYADARRHGEEAMELSNADHGSPIFSWGLMVAACGEGDFDTVQELNHELLIQYWEMRIIPFLLMGVTFGAILAAYRDKDARRATELLALSSTHPSSMAGWFKCWTFIENMKHDLENELGATAYRIAWEHGQALDWEPIISDLITEYENGSAEDNGTSNIPGSVLAANAELFEPLSERELEVLLKIGEGYTNREIADELFVGVSTVKKHITHIYSKLQVESRTQALLHAQELRLI